MVSKSTDDRDLTVGTSSNSTAINESTVSAKTLQRCFNERIDRERSNIVDIVEDRIQNEILTAFDNIIAHEIELAIRSINASCGRDVTSVIANSERGEQVGINAFFENASGKNILHVSNVNDGTRQDNPDEVSELSVPKTHSDRQTHTHHMVTGQTAQINQILEFLTGRILTPRNPPSHHSRNLAKQVSQDNNLPNVEQTPTNQNSDANSSIIRLADAIAGNATQQRPQASTMLKPVSTNTFIFDGKNEEFEHFEDLFHKTLKMQLEMTEGIKINHFDAHLRKEALQTFRNINAFNKKTLDHVLIVFRRKFVKPESQDTAKHKWHKLTFDPSTKSLSDLLEELNECTERAFGDNAQHMIDSLIYAKPGHVFRDCRKRMRKEQEQRNDPSTKNTTPSTSKSFAPCSHCQRTSHPPEKCWSCPNAANRPKRFKQEYPADIRNDGQDQGNLTHPAHLSIL